MYRERSCLPTFYLVKTACNENSFTCYLSHQSFVHSRRYVILHIRSVTPDVMDVVFVGTKNYYYDCCRLVLALFFYF